MKVEKEREKGKKREEKAPHLHQEKGAGVKPSA